MAFGPQGKTYNFDSYLTATPPPTPPPPVVVINPADAKTCSPAPGTKPGATINHDTYHV